MHSELIHRLMHKGIYSHPSRTLHNQKQPKLFGIYTFNAYLCKDNLCRDCHRSSKESTMRIVLWCNGSTTGFGSVCPGSNPGRTTQKSAYADFFYYITNQDKTPLDCQQKEKNPKVRKRTLGFKRPIINLIRLPPTLLPVLESNSASIPFCHSSPA